MSMREQQLKQWCEDKLEQELQLNALSGDASFRRYFRIDANQQSWIAADAPPETEKNAEFVHIANLIAEQGVLAPQVYHSDIERGFLLLSDLGDQTLLPLLSMDTVDGYYKQALDSMIELQKIDASSIAAYDKTLLHTEMQLFPDWFVSKLLGYELSEKENVLINQVFDLLAQSALAQPQVFVHRDFHSRNLMLDDGKIAVIDFQDAVKGAITYDLVSLLRDCYVEWPMQQVYAWLEGYRLKAIDHQLIDSSVDQKQFEQWFDWMGLQRHIKVLGIFARLSMRDGKDGYLLDLPLVMKYTREVLARYADQALLSEFLSWFDDKLLPLAQQQDWIVGRKIA